MFRKRVLVNAYTHVNLGDDLFLKILFDKFPDTQFTIIGNKKKYQEIFNGYSVSYISFPTIVSNKFLRRLFSKFFRYQFFKYQFLKKKVFLTSIESEFDAVVTIGGSIFIENDIKNSFKFGNHKLIADVFKGKPKFIIGSNFGPYKNESYLHFFTKLFSTYDDVCFRDQYSKSLFDELNNVRCFPDVVFSGDFESNNKVPQTIGISVMDFSRRLTLSKYHDDYIKLVMEIVKSYVVQNYTPYLYSFCEYEGDERAIDEILNLLDDKYSSQVKKVFYKGDIESFLESFSKMEVMYSSRFHAMILSMIYEQQIHPIVYSKKMSDVLEDLSYKGKFTDVKKIEKSIIEVKLANEDHFFLNNDVKYAADRQFEALEKYIKS